MQIGRKIYYLKSTGEVLLNTGESEGFVVETTFEEDYRTYGVLNIHDKNEIDFIKLKYGEFKEEFGKATSYKVDVGLKKIIFDYSEKEIITAPADENSLEKRVEIIEEDNKLTKSAIDTLMMMAMENSMPMMTLSAEEISSDKINTKQKGEDTMAAYIAKRCIDLETEKEGAGKDYYRLYLSSAVWGKYKEDVDFILADLGRADLIVEL